MCETSNQNIAVFGQQICFSYTKSEPILKEIYLTVKKGTIYGLLGSSGCGKTTLLKCILGRLDTKSGEIHVFGINPGSNNYLPGPAVGYMPQELALIPEFTIEEILTYFGKIYAMNSIEIRERTEKLTKLLDLKNKNKSIGNQSGGQQRRISLACTLIHSPPLLILDEPTVGTDPVLRQNIWLHLMELCELGQTIILTTHYIEEARNANTVAFMRSGKILAEDEPNLLLNKYESNNLEDVFLKLCHSETEESIDESLEGKHVENYEQNQKNRQNAKKHEKYFYSIQTSNKNNQSNIQVQNFIEQVYNQNINNNVQQIRYRRRVSVHDNFVMNTNEGPNSVRNSRFHERCSALLHKNYIRITRNWKKIVFELLLPSILAMICIYNIADKPSGINLAISNEETFNNRTESWGQIFVDHLDKVVFNITFYDNIEEAIDSVYSGQNSAAIEINDRFTKALRLRFLYMTEANEDTIDESQIYVHIDRSSSVTGIQIEYQLYLMYLDFLQDVANKSHINSAMLKNPIIFEKPIYGNENRSRKEYAIPGVYVLLLFYMSGLITINMIIEERVDGIYERSIVAGIKAPEFILSNIITHIFIVCFQILFILLLPYLVLGQQLPGSFVLFISLLFTQGICGITFGLCIAIIFTNISIATIILFFWLIVATATATVLWPLHEMPPSFQFISKLMPNTIPIQSLRDVMYRQWTIDYTEVYMGFVVSFLWMTFFLITALILLRLKR